MEIETIDIVVVSDIADHSKTIKLHVRVNIDRVRDILESVSSTGIVTLYVNGRLCQENEFVLESSAASTLSFVAVVEEINDTLTSMGFEKADSDRALEMCNGDVETAIQLLTESPHVCKMTSLETPSNEQLMQVVQRYPSLLSSYCQEMVNRHKPQALYLIQEHTETIQQLSANTNHYEDAKNETDSKMQQLLSMGFSKQDSQMALENTDYNTEHAITLLLSNV